MESTGDTEKHELFDGAVTLFRRPRSRFWQCYASLDGEMTRKSSKETNLALARDFAELWYLDLRTKTRNGEALGGRKFRQAAIQFEREPELSYKDAEGKWVNGARGYSSQQLRHLIRAAVLADIEISKLNFAASVPTANGEFHVN